MLWQVRMLSVPTGKNAVCEEAERARWRNGRLIRYSATWIWCAGAAKRCSICKAGTAETRASERPLLQDHDIVLQGEASCFYCSVPAGGAADL